MNRPEDRREPSYDPRVPDPELEPGEKFELIEEKEAEQSEGEQKKKKKAKLGVVDEKYRDRILERDPREEAEEADWWKVPAVVGGIGGASSLITVIVVAFSFGPLIGLLVGGGLLLLTVIQVVGIVLMLMVIGETFGINYGPMLQAVVKLTAITLFVNGLNAATITLGVYGIVPAGLIGWAVFMYVFRLDYTEMAITYGIIVGSSTILKLFAIFVVWRKVTGH